MMKLVLQWLYLAGVVLAFFLNLRWAICGKPASKPMGFLGAVTIVVVYAILVPLYFKAGFFREIFP